jgi:DNA-binding phage protein
MERAQKPRKVPSGGKALTVSHRARLIGELRADPELAAEYLNAAAEDSDPRVYLAALRTVAEARGMAKIAKAADGA